MSFNEFELGWICGASCAIAAFLSGYPLYLFLDYLSRRRASRIDS